MKKTTKNTNEAANTAAAAKAEEVKTTTATPAASEAGKPTLKERRQELRRELSALSMKLKGEHPEEKSINKLLLAHYAAKLGSQVFKSWKAWEREGRHIKRGQHAVTIWRPAEDNGKARYLMQFLFAESQTYERRAPEAAPEAPAAAVAG